MALSLSKYSYIRKWRLAEYTDRVSPILKESCYISGVSYAMLRTTFSFDIFINIYFMYYKIQYKLVGYKMA